MKIFVVCSIVVLLFNRVISSPRCRAHRLNNEIRIQYQEHNTPAKYQKIERAFRILKSIINKNYDAGATEAELIEGLISAIVIRQSKGIVSFNDQYIETFLEAHFQDTLNKLS